MDKHFHLMYLFWLSLPSSSGTSSAYSVCPTCDIPGSIPFARQRRRSLSSLADSRPLRSFLMKRLGAAKLIKLEVCRLCPKDLRRSCINTFFYRSFFPPETLFFPKASFIRHPLAPCFPQCWLPTAEKKGSPIRARPSGISHGQHQ